MMFRTSRFTPRGMAFAALVALAWPLVGCAATASFHPKNGRDYPVLTERAVHCERADVQAVLAAGGIPIGTVDGKALAVTATDTDVADEAAAAAAKSGGTHMLRTAAGADTYTTTRPAEKQKTCTRGDGMVDCKTTYTPASTSTFEMPTGSFVVYRVAPERWAALPEPIRPAALR